MSHGHHDDLAASRYHQQGELDLLFLAIAAVAIHHHDTSYLTMERGVISHLQAIY